MCVFLSERKEFKRIITTDEEVRGFRFWKVLMLGCAELWAVVRPLYASKFWPRAYGGTVVSVNT